MKSTVQYYIYVLIYIIKNTKLKCVIFLITPTYEVFVHEYLYKYDIKFDIHTFRTLLDNKTTRYLFIILFNIYILFNLITNIYNYIRKYIVK